MLRQICTLVVAVLVIGITFIVVYAAKHDGGCVSAKTTYSRLVNTCSLDAQGVCSGFALVQHVAVNGYCDANETGVCYDAVATFQIHSGQHIVGCEKVGPWCSPNTSAINSPLSTVTVDSCTTE
jgi:hypothetical protein